MIDDAVIFWTKRSISNQKVGFKGSTFKGSEVGPSFNYPYGLSGIGKSAKRLTSPRRRIVPLRAGGLNAER